jgi:polysaccharide chain length determinant protein (PEP-CTERM system associated)
MAVEFRQRKAGEFLQMFKRRKWHILLPTLALGLAVGYVVWKLPNMYESKTSLTLKPPTISSEIVKDMTEDDLSQRLQSMNQQILSRSTLEPMVGKYKLFERERAMGMPMELIIERMHKAIVVEPEKGEDGRVTGFMLKYRDRTPEAARNVVAELAGKYVNQQVAETIEVAEKTGEFLDNELQKAKTSLDEIEKQRLQIMMQNVDTLPESAQGLIAQLQGLRQREEGIQKSKETLIVEKGRLNDSIRLLNGQINIAQNMGQKDADDEAKTSRIEDTPAYAQMIKDLAEWKAKKENLLKQYREKHPDVIEAQTRIDKINEQIADLKKNSADRAKDAANRGNRKTEIATKNIELEKQKAENQIALIDQQISMKDQELRDNNTQIGLLEAKINTIPNVKVMLESINNQHQTAKTNFDELNKKRNDAQLQLTRESNAQGETIRVVDPANLPQSPVNATKKPMFALLGAGIGLAIGLFLAGIFEVPRLFKIQSIEDAKHYTGLPVLASVPPLLTRKEISWQKRSYWLKVLAGMVAAVGSIPLIIIALEKTRIFERLVS